MALLLGYGAGADQPVPRLRDDRGPDRPGRAHRRHRAPGGAQLHQGVRQGRAQGDVEDGHLHRRVLHRRAGLRGHRPRPGRSSTSTSPARVSRIGGVGLDVLAEEVAARHRFAYLDRPEEPAHRDLWAGGEYQWRREGEYHLFNPETVFKLQHATRTKRYDVFKEYTQLRRRPGRARSPRCAACSSFKDGVRPAGADRRGRAGRARSSSASPPARCRTARSRKEAHETLAIAMNRIGGKSNTGEGGEDADRYVARPERRPAPLGDQAGGVGPLRRDVASTSSTPTTSRSRWPRAPSRARAASCPGGKVYPWIAKTRHSTPGVGPHLARRRTTTSTRSRTSSSSSTT